MKYIYPLLFSLLFITPALHAQNWVHPGSVWTYNLYGFAADGFVRYTYQKDTVIQAQVCKELSYMSVINSLYFPHYDTSYSYNPVFTFSRNDSVFFFYKYKFYPAYFFNAKQGDTVLFHNAMCDDDSTLQQVIDSVGTVQINNETLRYYVARTVNVSNTLLSYTSVKVVEKLGALDNFMAPYFLCVTDGTEYSFRCYKDDSFPVYQANAHINCDYTDIINEPVSKPLKIYPIPASGNLHIISPLSNSTISIYNVLGQPVYNSIIIEMETGVDVSFLPTGVYFMKAVAGGNIWQEKFVIER